MKERTAKLSNFEVAVKNDLVKYEVNVLFGTVTITVKDVFPKNEAQVLEVIRYLGLPSNVDAETTEGV